MSQSVRVLHVFGRMNRGGAETFIMHVYRHIDRGRVQFDFAVHSPQPGHYDEEIRQLGGRIFILPRPRPATLPAYWQAFKKVLRHKGPFVAVHSHVHFFSGIPLAIAKDQGVPVRIAYSHSTSDGKGDNLFRRMYRWYMLRLIRKSATHLLGNSRASCEALYGPLCWRDGRVEIMRLCIDPAPFALLPQDRRALRSKLGLPLDAILVGHVGRFDRPKNHRFLVEIFCVLARRLPDARLVLVGDGPLRREVERWVAEKGLEERVHFLGVRTDVPEIMGCLDVFLFPSLWEGLGIVLVEAQAAGVSCVVSDVVPDEADLGLGLWYPTSLSAGPETWAERVVEALGASPPPWEVREQALRTHGYDAREVAKRLENLYVGD